MNHRHLPAVGLSSRVAPGIFRHHSGPGCRANGEILFSSNRAGLSVIWRIPASGGSAQRVPSAGPVAWHPSVSLSGKQLAYQHVDEEQNLWRLELKDETHARGRASILVPSPKTHNLLPRFSPDGLKIAFQTERTGYPEVWICDADGSNAVQGTDLQGFAGTPRWSPDGRYIAFDYRPREHSEIYVMEISGGRPHAIAAFADADNVIPSWSHDGKWVYFASNRGGKVFQVWKIGVNDGAATANPAIQMTTNGGFAAFESADGKLLFYTKPVWAGPGIWMTPVNGGGERRVWSGPGPDFWSNWDVTEKGIYFSTTNGEISSEINYLHFKSGRVTQVAKLEKPIFFGLTVSPDGRSLIYSQWERYEHDILVMKNFR